MYAPKVPTKKSTLSAAPRRTKIRLLYRNFVQIVSKLKKKGAYRRTNPKKRGHTIGMVIEYKRVGGCTYLPGHHSFNPFVRYLSLFTTPLTPNFDIRTYLYNIFEVHLSFLLFFLGYRSACTWDRIWFLTCRTCPICCCESARGNLQLRVHWFFCILLWFLLGARSRRTCCIFQRQQIAARCLFFRKNQETPIFFARASPRDYQLAVSVACRANSSPTRSG